MPGCGKEGRIEGEMAEHLEEFPLDATRPILERVRKKTSLNGDWSN
jgi:hypothetical protein